MIALDTLRVGLRELAANKLRTALTMLGIVFGVAAVIAMVSIAQGARQEALEQVQALGTNALRGRAIELEGADLSRARQGGIEGLSEEDAEAIARLPGVEVVAPLRISEGSARAEGRRVEARVVGTTPDAVRATALRVAEGRFLLAEDLVARAPVAVLGARVAQELLPFRSPVGTEIRLGDTTFLVVGVLAGVREAGSRVSALAIADPGRDVYVPSTTARVRLAHDALAPEAGEIAVRVAEGASVRATAALVRDLLRRRHQGLADAEVLVPEELLRQSQKSQRIFNVVMGAIASISLVVGGIGIMNVMLVTVVQRTREIGIRRAVGARRQDVRDQFLSEALVIAALGGGAGTLLGAVLAAGIAAFAGWLTIISPSAVLLALAVACGTGIAFGLFPAVKAARMDPIECLRHE